MEKIIVNKDWWETQEGWKSYFWEDGFGNEYEDNEIEISEYDKFGNPIKGIVNDK